MDRSKWSGRGLQLAACSPRSDTNRLANDCRAKQSLWATPCDFFRKLDAEFGFTLDVCALPENAKCKRHFTPKVDGLKQDWRGVCWMHPPYGREIGKWVAKALESARKGSTVVCLLPARTDTAWWHSYVMQANEIRFVKGRLRFVGAESSAPFASAVVVFRPWLGAVFMGTAQ